MGCCQATSKSVRKASITNTQARIATIQAYHEQDLDTTLISLDDNFIHYINGVGFEMGPWDTLKCILRLKSKKSMIKLKM